MPDDLEARARAGLAIIVDRAARKVIKRMAEERHEEFQAMLKKPRGSSDGKPARPPKAKRPRCGARTRRGTSCKAPAIWFSGEAKPRNGRCRNHGGLNPKWGDSARSVESRKQSAAAIGLEYDELTGRCHKPK